MGISYDRIDEWILREDSFDGEHLGKCEAVMSLGNGYMGLRSALEERYPGECRDLLVNGCFDCYDESDVTELANIADVTAVELWINGKRFSLDKGSYSSYSRELNIKTGELTRNVVWTSPDGDTVKLSFRRIVSLTRLHDIAMQISVTPLSGPIKIRLRSGINGQVTNTGTQHFIEGEKRFFDKKYLQLVERTVQSGIEVIVNATHRFFLNGEEIPMQTDINIDRRILYADYEVSLSPEETFTLEKFANAQTSRDLDWGDRSLSDMQLITLEDLKQAAAQGYSALAAQSAAAWDEEVWSKAPITIEGDESSHLDLFAVRFAQYHLRVMIPRHDARLNIGAKALSGEGYRGHCFWDTEIFLLPYYIFTDVEAARKLVEYRYLSLPGAHRKAAEYGYSGAMFPWESAWLDDGETCPAYMGTDILTGTPIRVWSGTIEQHISADVAFGVWQYVTATGDDAFMDKYGYELIMDTARFWASRLEKGEDGLLHINDVVGPDEYHEHVNDNAFTNYMARWNLQEAASDYERLSKENPELLAELSEKLDLSHWYPEWLYAAEHIYLPTPGDDNILPMDDRFMSGKYIDLTKYKEQPFVAGILKDYNLDQIQGIQVCKQADTLMLFFLLEELFPEEVRSASWDYYLDRTLHDSSLSLSTHSVLASDMGNSKLAKSLFYEACMIDMGPYMSTSDAGIHAASFGGVWQCAVYGFGGLRMVGGKLRIRPHLPESWTKLSFEVMWKGERIRVTLTAEEAKVENLSGKHGIAFSAGNKEGVLLEEALNVSMETLPEEGILLGETV